MYKRYKSKFSEHMQFIEVIEADLEDVTKGRYAQLLNLVRAVAIEFLSSLLRPFNITNIEIPVLEKWMAALLLGEHVRFLLIEPNCKILGKL